MKRFILPFVTFLLGIALGIGLMILVVQRGPNQVIAQMAYGQTSQGAIYGTLLQQKRYDDLQRLIENGFLTSLNFQKGLGLSQNGYLGSKKSVRGYFDFTGRTVPDEIQQHIQDIPIGSGIDPQRLTDLVTKQNTQ